MALLGRDRGSTGETHGILTQSTGILRRGWPNDLLLENGKSLTQGK
jgi:hypothetical protein